MKNRIRMQQIGAQGYAVLLLALAFGGMNSALGAPTPVRSLIEMRQEYVLIQKWDLSCGAAALATLLKYQFGEDVTEKAVAASLMRRPEYIEHPELIQIREGFSLLDLKRDVEARGYKGLGFGKMELKDLEQKAPIIVPITVRGYNHFVIFRGIRDGRAVLVDPAWGNRSMSVADFLDSWIDYPQLGKVGFQVQRKDGAAPSPALLSMDRPAITVSR